MKTVVLVNNKVGLEVCRHLKSLGEDIVGAVIHPIERRKYGEEILSLLDLPEDRILFGDTVNKVESIEKIKEWRGEICISVFFGYIVKKPFLDIFSGRCFNIHPAFLPFNRGSAPNVWAIIEGTPVGATLHVIDEGVDTGSIVDQRRVNVDLQDTGESLYRKLEAASLDVFKANWQSLKEDEFKLHIPVSRSKGSFHGHRDVDKIDEIFLDKAYLGRELINILRARTFKPYKGSFFRKDGRKFHLELKITEDKNELYENK